MPLLRLRAARSTAHSHTRFREGSGPSCSLIRFREGSRGHSSTHCLHKGLSLRDSRALTGSSDHSYHHVQGTHAPSSPCPETEGSGVGRQSEPTELYRLLNESTLTARYLRRAKQPFVAAPSSEQSRRCKACRLHRKSYRARAHRVWGSAGAFAIHL